MTWPFKRKETIVTESKIDTLDLGRVTREQLESASARGATSRLVEYQREHDSKLDALRVEDTALRDAARNGDTPVSAVKYKTGTFLAMGDGKELPVAFIEAIEIIPPKRGDSKSYLVNEPPMMGYGGEELYHDPTTGQNHSFRLFGHDGRSMIRWFPKVARAGHCYIAKAKLKITMSSGRVDEIEINPYACEAVYAEACRIWKDGK
jgi:hypothetical protein